ncbi:MAG TPA: phosphate ABC transporter permease subunit PstC, partial [Clostridiales bacterium]|nr:phosphate ABC transporter permease subunit PstC [Clostridiales bacterium]
MKRLREQLPAAGFLLIAFSTLSALAMILIFIFVEGVPLIAKVGLFDFVFGMTWAPTQGEFGIFPMIIGTLTVTIGAAVIGVPVALCCSIFLTEFAHPVVSKILRPAIQLLAGIPSVVYGFWGLTFVVPFIRRYLGGSGLSVLAGSIILAIMILPTI